MDDARHAAASAQDAAHPEAHDYVAGSPHLRHRQLRELVENRLSGVAGPGTRVLEVGAGHGTFTSHLLTLGAQVTVTEISSASAGHLRRTFGDAIEVIEDPSGEGVLETDHTWDVAVLASVVHHIPDYLSFVERLTRRIAEHGSLITVQDPLYYPRLSRSAHAADRAAYFWWRLGQGSYRRGLATRWRRLRGRYDDTPSDLVEYHVVRQGVDEERLAATLRARFDHVDVFTYWSTQSPLLQRLGERTRWRTCFGIEATGRRSPTLDG